MALLVIALIFRDDLFNKYDKHEYDIRSNTFDAGIVIDFKPNLFIEDDISKSGNPFTLRVVCKVPKSELCLEDISKLVIQQGKDVVRKVHRIDIIHNSLGSNDYWTIKEKDIHLRKSNELVCIALVVQDEGKEVCFDPVIETRERFFLLDWWVSV